jgi:hypothetical protein
MTKLQHFRASTALVGFMLVTCTSMAPTFATANLTSTSPKVKTEQLLAQQASTSALTPQSDFSKKAAEPANDTLKTGKKLTRGKSLSSRNGYYQFILQDDGNLVLYDLRYKPRKTLWSSRTNGQAIEKAVMQGDCNFVLYRYDGKPAFSSRTNGKGNSCYLSVQNDGNVVIYSHTSAGNPLPVWATNTVQ